MTTDQLLQQLSEQTTPPVPQDWDRTVHQRLNRALLAAHLADFACVALPRATAGLAAAVGDLILHAVPETSRTEPDSHND